MPSSQLVLVRAQNRVKVAFCTAGRGGQLSCYSKSLQVPNICKRCSFSNHLSCHRQPSGRQEANNGSKKLCFGGGGVMPSTMCCMSGYKSLLSDFHTAGGICTTAWESQYRYHKNSWSQCFCPHLIFFSIPKPTLKVSRKS